MNDFGKRDEVDYIEEPTDVRLQIVKVITDVLAVDDEVDAFVKNKLDSGPAHCTIISGLQNTERNTEQANCLIKKENLSIWLVSRGWALTNKEPDKFLSSQENLANENNSGIWRDGFIPPDLWRTSFKKSTKHCNICSVRRQSFLRKTPNLKSP